MKNMIRSGFSRRDLDVAFMRAHHDDVRANIVNTILAGVEYEPWYLQHRHDYPTPIPPKLSRWDRFKKWLGLSTPRTPRTPRSYYDAPHRRF